MSGPHRFMAFLLMCVARAAAMLVGSVHIYQNTGSLQSLLVVGVCMTLGEVVSLRLDLDAQWKSRL